MSLFGSGAGDYNREVKAAGDWAVFELGQGAISRRYQGMQDLFAPMLQGMGQAAQVGANMDIQGLQANLARQGLGGSGLGAALGSGIRTGATFQMNQLRAQLAMEALRQSIGLQQMKANTIMQRAAGQVPEAGAYQTAIQPVLQTAGYAAETASLF